MIIYFYKRGEVPYGVFSNFSHHGFELDGRQWPTCEHYFQAMKFEDADVQEMIRSIKSPMDAAQKGRDRSLRLRADWEAVKLDIMREALMAKFSQDPELRSLLLGTGDRYIIEKTNIDYFWGCGDDGHGQNMLGKLLMETRDRLKQST